MTVNSGEYKSRVGLDSLYIAEVTADTASGYTAGTPYYFAPAAEATLEPSTESAIQYADDQAYEVMTSEGETKIKLKITNIPLSVLADITGRVYDTGSGRFFDNPDAVPPYFALLFRSKTSSGDYRYYSYLKGRFEMPAEEIRTLGEKPDPKTTEIVYTASAWWVTRRQTPLTKPTGLPRCRRRHRSARARWRSAPAIRATATRGLQSARP